jgi:hypothetical protein
MASKTMILCAASSQPSFGTDPASMHGVSQCLIHCFSQAAKAKRKVIFKRAESYVKEYLSKEREEIRLKRAARTSGDFYVPAQPKVLFVIRVRGSVTIWPGRNYELTCK